MLLHAATCAPGLTDVQGIRIDNKSVACILYYGIINMDVDIKIRIYKNIILPVVLYGCET